MPSMYGCASPFLANIFNIAGVMHIIYKRIFSQGGMFATFVTRLNFISCSISLKRAVRHAKKQQEY